MNCVSSSVSAACLTRSVDFRGSWPRSFEPEAEVSRDRHVRIQRVALEHHRDVAVARLQMRDVAIADQDGPGARLLQAGDQPQQRALAAARRTDQHQQFAVANVERRPRRSRHGRCG